MVVKLVGIADRYVIVPPVATTNGGIPVTFKVASLISFHPLVESI